MIRVSTFPWVPPIVQGYVRDLRVRWALEELGLSYEERLVTRDDRAADAYRALQPFGQVPSYEEDGLDLFESGAIVLHIAARSDVLLPAGPAARARVITWMFAALNTVEPPVQNLNELDLFAADADWAVIRRPAIVESVKARLAVLARCLDGKDYLEGGFSAADLLMSTVLRCLDNTDFLIELPVLQAYWLRCEARPAFKKALADQLASYQAHAPA